MAFLNLCFLDNLVGFLTAQPCGGVTDLTVEAPFQARAVVFIDAGGGAHT